MENKSQFRKNELIDMIHSEALNVSIHYKKTEARLIGVLQKAEEHKVFLHKGYASLYQYVVRELKLSESVAYNLITVCRKAREIPELNDAIEIGKINLSNARRIVPVLDQNNKNEWIGKAATLSQRQLEKEIAIVRPQEATKERATYVTASRVKLELGLTEKEMMKLRRVQDIVSGNKKRPVSLEEVVEMLTEEYLNRHDPLEKANRVWVKKGLIESQTEIIKTPVSRRVEKRNIHELQGKSANRSSSRTPIPAMIRHRVNLRDKGQCAYVNSSGERCDQKRWIEMHHVTPVSQGGENEINNLTTLCSAHHDWVHARMH